MAFGGFTWASLGISQVDEPGSPATCVGDRRLGRHVRGRLRERGARGLGRPAGEGSGAGSASRSPPLAAVLAPALIALPAASPADPVTIAVVQVDVRVPADTSPVRRGPDRCAQRNLEEHRTLGARRRRPTWSCGGRGRSTRARSPIPRPWRTSRPRSRAVGVPTTVGAVVNDPDGTQRTSVLAFDAHRAARRPLRQGASRPVRRVRAVAAHTCSWVERDRADPGRSDAGEQHPHDHAAGPAQLRHADLLRERLPVDPTDDGARRSELLRRARSTTPRTGSPRRRRSICR